MADLLSHVLVAYVLFTIGSWRIKRVTPAWTAVGMAGAAIPDLSKASLILEGYVVEETVGIPFDYAAVSTFGGVLLLAGVIIIAFRRRYWRRAYGCLVVGGVTSLVVDGLRAFADGHSTSWLFPFTWWRPPTPNLYVSSDLRIVAVTAVFALVVLILDIRLRSGTDDRLPTN